MKLRKYTIQQLTEAIKNSFTYGQVLTLLNITPAGGNYSTLKKAIKYYNLDITHFTGQSRNKGCIIGPKRPIEDYLSNQQSINSDTLRKRLIRENIFEHKCYKCFLTTWLNEPIPLELHHINGNREDNNLSNLTLLCNCTAIRR
jgi:hypothetical protein